MLELFIVITIKNCYFYQKKKQYITLRTLFYFIRQTKKILKLKKKKVHYRSINKLKNQGLRAKYINNFLKFQLNFKKPGVKVFLTPKKVLKKSFTLDIDKNKNKKFLFKVTKNVKYRAKLQINKIEMQKNFSKLKILLNNYKNLQKKKFFQSEKKSPGGLFKQIILNCKN